MILEFDPDQSALVTLLGPASAQTQLPARILSTSGRKMTIVADLTAPIGAAVQVQWSKYLVLAEIIGAQQANRTLSLQIRHALKTDDIEHIRQRWA